MSAVPDEKYKAKLSNSTGALPLSGIDRYQLQAFLGAGGMGQVYMAVHTVTQRRCALKLLPDQLSSLPDFVSRFHAEAQMLARLNHRNIVQIYSGGESQGKFFLEMEYIDGGDLQKRVAEYKKITGDGLPETEVFRITEGILNALDYAHRQHVVHRDLKPANILLSQAGEVKVSDFGLAAVIGEDFHRAFLEKSISVNQVLSQETVSHSDVGSSNAFAGTILYMSPQALRAEPPDPRDDLFSLGVVIYFMLTGKTPSVHYTPVSRLRPGLKREWDKFIATCLAEERSARYPNAASALHSLAGAGRRRPLRMAGIIALIALLTAGGVLGTRSMLWSRPQIQTIEFPTVTDHRIGEPDFALLARSSSGLPVQVTVVSGPAKIANNQVTLMGEGTVVLRASQPGDSRFLAAEPVLRRFDVGLGLNAQPTRTQSINFEPLPVRTLGDPEVELDGTATSGLPLTYSVSSGPGTVNGRRLGFTGVGTVTVRADQRGNTTFLPAMAVERSFVVQDLIPNRLVVILPDGSEMPFVRIPAGHMMLGSPESEMGRRSEETPHEYSRADAFLLGATEVTQAQFQSVMGTRPSYQRIDWKNRPVEQIKFSDITDGAPGGRPGFFAKFNAFLNDNGFADWEAVLPSEDEWEYACRADTTTAFNNGANLTNAVRDPKASLVAAYGRSETSIVGKFQPNAWGLSDMHGNVAEWTRDGTLRGGSFKDDASACRSAARLRGQANSNELDSRFGFRVMLKRKKGSHS